MNLDYLPSLAPEFRSPIYAFDRAPPSQEIDRRMKSYDPSLFLLWSLLHNRWELWRWKRGVLPHRATSERSLYEEARLQAICPVGYTPDMRLIDNLARADTWLQAGGTDDPDRVSKAVSDSFDEASDKAEEDKSKQVRDLVEDNAKILRREMADGFRGYYPSAVNTPYGNQYKGPGEKKGK